MEQVGAAWRFCRLVGRVHYDLLSGGARQDHIEGNVLRKYGLPAEPRADGRFIRPQRYPAKIPSMEGRLPKDTKRKVGNTLDVDIGICPGREYLAVALPVVCNACRLHTSLR